MSCDPRKDLCTDPGCTRPHPCWGSHPRVTKDADGWATIHVGPLTPTEAVRALPVATDQLNERIRDLEATLAAAGFGVPATISLERAKLSFRKWDNEWRLMIDDAAGKTPLVNASREYRLEAATRFHDLVTEIQNNTNSELTRVQQAIAATVDTIRHVQSLVPGLEEIAR